MIPRQLDRRDPPAEVSRRPNMRVRVALLAFISVGTSAGVASSQVPPRHPEALGTVEFPISCSPASQTAFNRAVALLHHMTYPQARQAFEAIARSEPQCAMPHWGIAMTLFQPLWPTRPGPADLRRGWDAVQQARALEPVTERERLFIEAAEAFFREPASADYWTRIRRWSEAMERVHRAFPDDPETTAFRALAGLATAPTDPSSRANADRAAELLLAVHARNPDHPGAVHYLVHANDVTGREHESPEIVRQYEAVAPRNPHALHMPTHIYTRLGDWEAVIRGNLRAAEAAIEHPAGDRGQYVWDEFPHAIEYLVYAHLQRADDDAAADQARRLVRTPRLEPTFKTAFHLASTAARVTLERRDWAEAMKLPPRAGTLDWDQFRWPEAVVWFAKGLGAVHSGQLAPARDAERRLAELGSASERAGEELFTRNIRILRLGVSAWIAHAAGQRDSSVALMRAAAELEVATPKHAVTPAPTIPAFELLGDLLLEQNQPARALEAYRRSLELYPRRFNSLLGAARAARAAQDPATARVYYRELLEVGGAGSRRAILDEARSFGSTGGGR
jgi:tetratricopeptide (TPR) repeat protein